MEDESELQRFERLCREAGIQTTTLNFHADQQKVYKFFKAVIKDCEKKDTIVVEKEADKETIISRIKKYSPSGLTFEELSSLTRSSLSSVKTICKELIKEGTICETERGDKKTVKINDKS